MTELARTWCLRDRGRSIRRSGSALILGALMAMTLAGPAEAATLKLTEQMGYYGPTGGYVMSYTAAPGERNDVRIKVDLALYWRHTTLGRFVLVIRDTGAHMAINAAGDGVVCRRISEGAVCELAFRRQQSWNRLDVELGDRDDVVDVNGDTTGVGTYWILSVDGGDGGDLLRANLDWSQPGAYLQGGAGDDVIVSANGPGGRDSVGCGPGSDYVIGDFHHSTEFGLYVGDYADESDCEVTTTRFPSARAHGRRAMTTDVSRERRAARLRAHRGVRRPT